MCDEATKIIHLTDILAQRAVGKDAIENSTNDGGVLLEDDSGDILDIVCQIDDDIIPYFYDGNWKQFLIDFLCVQSNAASDGTGSILGDIRYWIETIQSGGKKMVA